MRHLLVHLLTFRYYSAALVIRGIADYLKGPGLFHEAPQALHAGLTQYRVRYPQTTSPRGRVIYDQPPSKRRLPRGRAGYIALFPRLILQQFMRPTREAPVRRMPLGQFSLVGMRDVEHVAVDTLWDYDLPVFKRSRENFRELAFDGVRVLWQLYRRGPETARLWQASFPELVSRSFWQRYLGLGERQHIPVDDDDIAA